MDRENLQNIFDGKLAELKGRSDITAARRMTLLSKLQQGFETLLLDPTFSEEILDLIGDVAEKVLDLDQVAEQVGAVRTDIAWLKSLAGLKLAPEQVVDAWNKKDEISFQIREAKKSDEEIEE